jgi:Rod binding domain-containing protein
MIDNISSVSSTMPVPAGTPPAADKIKSTAQQFEALLIGELLKSSRESGSSGWLGTGEDDEPGQTGIEVGEQEFARMLASSGGLGLSKSIEAAMRRDSALAERK